MILWSTQHDDETREIDVRKQVDGIVATPGSLEVDYRPHDADDQSSVMPKRASVTSP